MGRVQVSFEEVIRLAVYALRNDNASGALNMLEDVLRSIDASRGLLGQGKQEVDSNEEETPTLRKKGAR